MGTSTGYGMPTGGDWTPLKSEATRFAKAGGGGRVSPERLLGDYIRACGGARAISQGIGGRAGGGGGGGARGVARGLGGFLASVGEIGLDGALRELGLESLIGASASEVADALVDLLAAPGSTIDEHAARIALIELKDELFADSETYEDVSRTLSEAIDIRGLSGILASFFGHYLFERFCRDFYETWVKKVGADYAARSLESVKDCIESGIRAKFAGRDLKKINWRGRQGLAVVDRVLDDTLDIFEIR